MSAIEEVADNCVSAEEAFVILGVGRTSGYRAISAGTFPVPIVRVGRSIRVPVLPLRRLLGADPAEGDPREQYHG